MAHLNWFNNKTVSWGLDDIIDALQQFSPDWTENSLEDGGRIIYLWARRGNTAIYIYDDCAAVWTSNPGKPIWFDDPIEAIFFAINYV